MCKNPKFVRAIASANPWPLVLIFIGSLVLPDSALAACEWQNVPSGSIDPSSFLVSAAAISSTDAWAVGTGLNPDQGNTNQTLAEHWDGQRWRVVPGADIFPVKVLNGVAAISTSDVWAVGYQFNNGPIETLVEQWN